MNEHSVIDEAKEMTTDELKFWADSFIAISAQMVAASYAMHKRQTRDDIKAYRDRILNDATWLADEMVELYRVAKDPA